MRSPLYTSSHLPLILLTCVSHHLHVSAAPKVLLNVVPLVNNVTFGVFVSNGILDVGIQFVVEGSEHVHILVEHTDLKTRVRREELGQNQTGNEDGVYPEEDPAPGGGGQHPQYGAHHYDGPQSDEGVGEDGEPGVDEVEPGHVVAGVEVQTEEEHPEPGGQKDDVGDRQTYQVYHDVDVEVPGSDMELFRILSRLHDFIHSARDPSQGLDKRCVCIDNIGRI